MGLLSKGTFTLDSTMFNMVEREEILDVAIEIVKKISKKT